MLILTVRTDKPEAEIGLFDGQTKLSYYEWYAHRELSLTLHQKIMDLLTSQQKELNDLEGIVAFKGPGSFTGLRIGLTVANSLAYGLGIPIRGTQNEEWVTQGLADLEAGKNDTAVLPEYGAPVHITVQKK